MSTLEPLPCIDPSASGNNEALAQYNSEIKIIQCEHVVQNADKIADALSDCDVLAFEIVGVDAESRKDFEETANLYISPNVDESSRSFFKRYLDSCDLTGYHSRILSHFIGSKKTVCTLDINSENPNSEILIDSIDSLTDLRLSVLNGNHPTRSDAIAKVIEFANNLGKTSPPREELVSQQLRAIAASNPGRSIGAAIGLIHSGVYHELSEHFLVTREFIPTPRFAAPGPGQRIKFGYLNRLIRQVRFGISDAASSPIVERAILEALDVEGKLTTHVIEIMSDAEVTSQIDTFTSSEKVSTLGK